MSLRGEDITERHEMRRVERSEARRGSSTFGELQSRKKMCFNCCSYEILGVRST